MKKFKIVSNVMLIVAVSLFFLGIILPALSPKSALEGAFLLMVQANALLLALAGIGAFLMFSKNEAARKAGNGMAVVGFIVGTVCALTILVNVPEGTKDQSIGAICMLIAAVLLLLHYAFLLVSHILKRNGEMENPNENIKIIRIKEWKQLMEEGIITQEEFEEKRVQILGIKSNADKAN